MRQYIVRAIFTAIIVIFLLLLDYSKDNWETVKDNLYNCNNIQKCKFYIYMNNFWNNLSGRIKILYHKIKEKIFNMNAFLLYKRLYI